MRNISWKRLLLIVAFTIFGFYYLIPVLSTQDFAKKDQKLWVQMNFLTNAGMCIRDFNSKNGRNPDSLEELFFVYQELNKFKENAPNDRILYYPNEKNDVIMRIENSSSNFTLDLTKEGRVLVKSLGSVHAVKHLD